VKRFRWASPFGLLVLASATGCSFNWGQTDLLDLNPRGSGSDAFWTAVQDSEGDAAATFDYTVIPGYFSMNLLGFDAARKKAVGVDWLLVGPIAGLPFYQKIESRLDVPGGDGAGKTMHWTPFFVSSSEDDWPADGPRVELTGIPLLWTHTLAELDTGGFQLAKIERLQLLWSLGPEYLNFDARSDVVESERVQLQTFQPLALAGFGSILWSSLWMDAPTSIVTMHGPLSGGLGYIDMNKTETDGRRDELTLCISGALWMSSADYDAEGDVKDSAHGPLWGVLGYGRDDYRPVIRFLWIPIPVGAASKGGT